MQPRCDNKLDKSRKCYHFNVCGSPRQPTTMGVEKRILRTKPGGLVLTQPHHGFSMLLLLSFSYGTTTLDLSWLIPYDTRNGRGSAFGFSCDRLIIDSLARLFSRWLCLHGLSMSCILAAIIVAERWTLVKCGIGMLCFSRSVHGIRKCSVPWQSSYLPGNQKCQNQVTLYTNSLIHFLVRSCRDLRNMFHIRQPLGGGVRLLDKCSRELLVILSCLPKVLSNTSSGFLQLISYLM
jgi:hypothetical protein